MRTGTVLVLDPVGTPVHGGLPATWRDLGAHHDIVWCGRGADGFWGEARALLDKAPGPVDIVASGAAVAAAMTLGREHAGTVRSVLLVDPASGERTVRAADASTADAEWQRHEADRIRAMAAEGVRVRVIAHSWVGDDDRRDPPLPLGHPVVAARVTAQLDLDTLTVRDVLDRTATLSALDVPAAVVRRLIDRVLPAGRVRDALRGDWLGHPLHPALAQLPIGMYVSAAVLDLLPGSKYAADVLIGLGLASSVPAAAAGAAEYSTAAGAQRRVGFAHVLLNSAGMVCYASSLWSRMRGHRLSGKASALTGLLFVGASAAVGGHLAYRHGMGMDQRATP